MPRWYGLAACSSISTGIEWVLIWIFIWILTCRSVFLCARKCTCHVGDNPVDSAFEPDVGCVARDCDSRDNQHVLGHRLAFLALTSLHKHSIQVSHYRFLTSLLRQHCSPTALALPDKFQS